MYMNAFVQSAHSEAWRAGDVKPTVVVYMPGRPKLRDVAIFAQALLPGQILRVVGTSRQIQTALEPFCAAHKLTITCVDEDRVLTFFGCCAHYYIDLQAIVSMINPAH